MDLSKALGPLTKKFVWEYITSSKIPLFSIKSLFSYAITQLVRAFKDVFVAILVLIIYLALVIAKICVILFPFAQWMTKVAIEWHYTLTWSDITIEVITLTIIIIFIIFQKKIKSFWNKLEKSVSTKFRYLVRLAPHILFFGFAFIFSIAGQKILIPFASVTVLPVISLGIPVIKSFITINRMNTPENQYRIYAKLRDELLIWVVLGAYHALATMLGVVPFSKRILRIVPYFRELSLVILVWIQLSPFFAKIVFDASLPLLKAIAARIPSSDISFTQSAGLLSGLKYMNMISTPQEVFLKSVLQDGTALILGLLFIFMPTSVAYVGVVIIAFFFPIFRTYKHVYENDEIVVSPQKRKPSREAEDDCNTGQEHLRRWLRYWICLGVLWLTRIYMIGFWPSILMLSTLWLQHSYFDGSRKIFEFLYELTSVLRERHDRILRERREDDVDHDVGIADIREIKDEDKTS